MIKPAKAGIRRNFYALEACNTMNKSLIAEVIAQRSRARCMAAQEGERPRFRVLFAAFTIGR